MKQKNAIANEYRVIGIGYQMSVVESKTMDSVWYRCSYRFQFGSKGCVLVEMVVQRE